MGYLIHLVLAYLGVGTCASVLKVSFDPPLVDVEAPFHCSVQYLEFSKLEDSFKANVRTKGD